MPSSAPQPGRRSRHRGLLFYRLVDGALAADPHPYATLVTPREKA